MKYCQECGSEIAETVVFCPYCGISQSSIQGKEEDAQNNTIAFNHSELADLVGNKNEASVASSPSAKPDILPEAEVKFSEKQVIKEEFDQPQNVTAENWVSKTDSNDISPQFILNTNDSFKLTRDKEVTDNDRNSSINTALEMFEEKAEMSLKNQIELQRIIFVQNQRIIELLEELLKKKP
jgi:hypothetical protein